MFYRVQLLVWVVWAMLLPAIAWGSGRPGKLDEFALQSKYIVIAECKEAGRGKKQWPLEATLKVETVLKAPKDGPAPKTLKVFGVTSSANRFNFKKGGRFLVFVDSNMCATRQGSSITIEPNGTLGGLSQTTNSPGELVCLEKNTNTVEKLTKQIKRVLSGEYKAQLLDNIPNKKLSFPTRTASAVSLARLYPDEAVKPLVNYIRELCLAGDLQSQDYEGVCGALVRVSPQETAKLWLELCKNEKLPYPSLFYYTLTYAMANRNVLVPDIKKHLPSIMKRYKKWKTHDPGDSPAAYLLPLLARNGCRDDQVKAIVVEVLSLDKIDHVTRIMVSAATLNFPETVPLFWKQLKRLEASTYAYSSSIPHPFVVGVMVYKKGPGELKEARKALLRKFPEIEGRLSKDNSPINAGRGWYFLTQKNPGGNQVIYFVARCHDSTSGPREKWTYKFVPIRLIGTETTLSEKEARVLAAELSNRSFAAKKLVNPLNNKPIKPFLFKPGRFHSTELKNGRWEVRSCPPAGVYSVVSFSPTGSEPKVDIGFATH